MKTNNQKLFFLLLLIKIYQMERRCTFCCCWRTGSAVFTTCSPSRKASSRTGPIRTRRAISPRWRASTSARSIGRRWRWRPSATCPRPRPTPSESRFAPHFLFLFLFQWKEIAASWVFTEFLQPSFFLVFRRRERDRVTPSKSKGRAFFFGGNFLRKIFLFRARESGHWFFFFAIRHGGRKWNRKKGKSQRNRRHVPRMIDDLLNHGNWSLSLSLSLSLSISLSSTVVSWIGRLSIEEKLVSIDKRYEPFRRLFVFFLVFVFCCFLFQRRASSADVAMAFSLCADRLDPHRLISVSFETWNGDRIWSPAFVIDSFFFIVFFYWIRLMRGCRWLRMLPSRSIDGVATLSIDWWACLLLHWWACLCRFLFFFLSLEAVVVSISISFYRKFR